MKKAILFLCFALLLSGTALAAEPPEESAGACVLLEQSSGRVLYENNADEALPIASITKILTALVVLEHCRPEETVTILPEWTGIEGSSAYLQAGEQYSVYELLAGLMLASGNDAATALAGYTAGGEDEFARRMNQKAEALGCENSHFTNPSGLNDALHYSTARDMARIACGALENETLREIFSAKVLEIHGSAVYNHNKLLSLCPGCFGMKTGYTMAAGRTLVSCCERDGMTLVCVTLSDRNDWQDHRALYDWAYENWHMTCLRPECLSVPVVGSERDSVSVGAAEGVWLPLCGTDETEFQIELPRFVYAGVEAGEALGCARLYLNGQPAAELTLQSCDAAAAEEKIAGSNALASLWNGLGRSIYSF